LKKRITRKFQNPWRIWGREGKERERTRVQENKREGSCSRPREKEERGVHLV